MTLEDLSKEELIKIIKELQIDKLTGFYRREKIADLDKQSYIVAMLDINNLKLVNDNLGHNKGDELIKKVADSIRKSIRSTDTVIRYGGDEFIIIFDNCTLEQANSIVSRIKYVSYGIGVSNCFDKALELADNSMYARKVMFHAGQKERVKCE